MEEIPDKVSLAVEVTCCQQRCPGCHSSFLREDIGDELDEAAIDGLLSDNFGVNCFLFLGEGNDAGRLLELARHVRDRHGIPVAVYSGRRQVEEEFYRVFDYVKVGPYNALRGPLNSSTTNQRLYKVTHLSSAAVEYMTEDITWRFWHKGLDPNAKRGAELE